MFCSTTTADPPLKTVNVSDVFCSLRSFAYNLTNDYQKTICVISGSRNYTNSRQKCQQSGMELYDTKDFPDSTTELFKFLNKTFAANSGKVFYIKGRKDSFCANVNNTLGGFSEGFGSCSMNGSRVCQLLEVSRNFKKIEKLCFNN